MTKVRTEDIVFWIIIFLMIALAIWLLSGSPTDTSAIVALAVFVASSELLIWRNLFNMDKKTATGFENLRGDINCRFLNLTAELNEIKTIVKKK